MSTAYKNSSDVPLDTLANRLRELSDAILGGRATQANEFTMRIPAECDRDADIVLSESAARLQAVRDYNAQLQSELTAAKAEIEQQKALIAELVEALDFTRINEQVIKGALKKHRAWKEQSNG